LEGDASASVKGVNNAQDTLSFTWKYSPNNIDGSEWIDISYERPGAKKVVWNDLTQDKDGVKCKRKNWMRFLPPATEFRVRGATCQFPC